MLKSTINQNFQYDILPVTNGSILRKFTPSAVPKSINLIQSSDFRGQDILSEVENEM